MWVHDLARADAHCGGKAMGLARLLAGGLPVPPGFVIDDHAFRHLAGEIVLDDPDTIGHVLASIIDRFATVALPEEVTREIDTRADALAAVAGFAGLAVRSSATIEDRQVGAAAGVFSSRTAVPRADLWHAIRGVWISALTPLAVTYARRRGGPISIGVIVQAYVTGEQTTIYTRRPGSPAMDEVLVQRATSISRLSRSSTDAAVVLALRSEAAIAAPGGADVELVGDQVVQARPIVHPPRRPQRSIAPPTVTSLLVADGRTWTWDIAHNPDPLSTAQSELVERVDHANVAPYSMRVCSGYLYSARRVSVTAPPFENLKDIETRLAALVGDLAGGDKNAPAKTDPGIETNAPTRAKTDLGIAPARAKTDLGIAVARSRTSESSAGIAVARVRTGGGIDKNALAVEDAIDRYVKFYAIWSNELSPLVASVRSSLSSSASSSSASSSGASSSGASSSDASSSGASSSSASSSSASSSPRSSHRSSSPPVGSRRSSVEALLLGVARGELDESDVMARLGVLSPSWDVVVPTYAERPELLRDALARAKEIVKVPRSAPSGIFRRIDPNARELVPFSDPADLGERDDYWFAKAQWMVRRALLERGRALGLDEGDVFWLPLATLADNITVDDARRRAAAARAAAARATRWEMPLVIEGADSPEPVLRGETRTEGRTREPSYGPPGALVAQARGDHAFRGIGSGGRVQGRVVRFASLASSVTVGRGDVVVARAITPALAVMVIGCAAIVSETGGFLDHGAAMARELGIPCVVGCKDAWTVLDDGMLVTVDGDSGLVTTHG